MFQLISRKIKEITPTVAEKILECNIYDGQRPIRKKHVKVLSNAINDGVFTVGHIAIAKQGWNGGDNMLVNGQHQCNAVLESGASINAVVEEYQCKTPSDFALLYRQFDNNAARNLAEVALPEARALKLDWDKRFLGCFFAGIAIVERFIDMSISKNQKVEYLKKYIPEGKFINALIKEKGTKDTKHIARGAVIAAVIVTYKKNANDAKIFWTEVRDGENLKSNSASLKLRNYLLSTSSGYGRGVSAPSLNPSASLHEMYSKCIIGWNAYRKGDSTQLKYFANKQLPKAI